MADRGRESRPGNPHCLALFDADREGMTRENDTGGKGCRLLPPVHFHNRSA